MSGGRAGGLENRPLRPHTRKEAEKAVLVEAAVWVLAQRLSGEAVVGVRFGKAKVYRRSISESIGRLILRLSNSGAMQPMSFGGDLNFLTPSTRTVRCTAAV